MDFSRSTDCLRKVFQHAKAVAQWREFGYIGSEHLLVALLTPQGGRAQAMLQKWGIDPEKVYREFIEPLPLMSQPDPCRHPCTPSVKEALERANTIAAATGSESVGPEHLLMGMLQVDRTRAGELLRREGITADWVRGEIMRLEG